MSYSDRVKCESCKNGSGPSGCTDCLNTGRDPHAFAGGIDEALNHAYAEGRKDEAEEHSCPLVQALCYVKEQLASNIAFDAEGVPQTGWDAVAMSLIRDIDAERATIYPEPEPSAANDGSRL